MQSAQRDTTISKSSRFGLTLSREKIFRRVLAIVEIRRFQIASGINLEREKASETTSMKRQCGDCSLCCKLVPVPPLGKPASEPCRYQKFRKGCTVYRTPSMPPECALWSCRWLVNDDAAELSRPDRLRYVIDVMPDFISLRDDATGELINIQVVQICIDPNHREAHRDPALRRWLHRRAEQGIAATIRINIREAIALFAPPLSADGNWHEMGSIPDHRGHTFGEVIQALAEAPKKTNVERTMRHDQERQTHGGGPLPHSL
jgi:hypothetical protein